MEYKKSNRRTLVRGALATGTLAVTGLPWPTAASSLEVQTVPLERLNPLKPLAGDKDFEEMRRLIAPAGAVPRAMMRLFTAYKKTGEYDLGEWALNYAFIWWRDLPRGPGRLKAAKAGQKISEQLRRSHPKKPAGWLYGALFIGFEALSVNVMNSLHLIPSYDALLKPSEQFFSDYLYNMAGLLRAKLYIKAPPFPVSVGNARKGLKLLEKLAPVQRKHMAPWYPIYAEGVYIATKDSSKAIAILDQIWTVKPLDYQTRFLLEMSVADANNFKKVLADGTYDQYLWDPMHHSLDELRHKNILEERPAQR